MRKSEIDLMIFYRVKCLGQSQNRIKCKLQGDQNLFYAGFNVKLAAGSNELEITIELRFYKGSFASRQTICNYDSRHIIICYLP